MVKWAPRRIGENFGVATERTSLTRLVRDLQGQQILPADAASGLMELIILGDRAAQGDAVSQDAGEWVMDVGPSILSRLDDLIADQGERASK